MFRWINSRKVLVRINREAQAARRSQHGKSGILINQNIGFLKHNMQHGEIVRIGSTIKKYQPEMEEGDTLLFSHQVEGSMENLSSDYIISTDEKYNYYFVNKDLYYAIVKPDGTVMVNEDIILAKPAEEELDSRETVLHGKILLFKNYVQGRTDIETKIAELKKISERHQNMQVKQSAMRQMEQLTKELNKRRLAAFNPIHVHETFNRDCGFKVNEKDQVFYLLLGNRGIELQVSEIEYNGINFSILRSYFVEAVYKKASTMQESAKKLADFISR